MAGANAGVKRNRRPAGVKVVKRDFSISEAADARLNEARLASGSLSLSLYLERLVQLLESEHGALPVLSPELDGVEVPKKTAA